MTNIHVCRSRACERAGSEATLCEIEELVSLVGVNTVNVKPSSCLGLCDQAPGVLIVSEDTKKEVAVGRVNCLESSAGIVLQATGREPNSRDQR